MERIFKLSSTVAPLDLQYGGHSTDKMKNVFLERGLRMEILTNNDTAFTSKVCGEFARNWDVHLRFRWAYSPSGNGIVERSHRTIKTITARKNCSILEVVYWYNVTPKDDVSLCTAPADALRRYHVRIKGVEDNPLPKPEVTGGKYEKGDVVWVKNPHGKCTTKYSTGRVTEVISPQSVKIDGVSCHIKDLQPVLRTQLSLSDKSDSEDSERLIYLNSNPLDSDSDASSLPTDEVSIETRTADKSTHEGEACVIPLRRSTRQRRMLPSHALFVIMRSRESVGKIVTYLTSVWACFVGFSRLTKKHSHFYIYLTWVTQTLAVPIQMRLCQVYKRSRGGNGRASSKKACCIGRHVQQDCLSQLKKP